MDNNNKPAQPNPELDAFEAFLASNPDQISLLMQTPFGGILKQINGLGFDSSAFIQELLSLGLFTKNLWIESVGLDTNSFLAITPSQYIENFPETGAPLVFAVLNSIHITDEQSNLLSKAGGSNLSKNQEVEIGVAAGLTGLYVIPRLIQHQVLTSKVFKTMEGTAERNFQDGNLGGRIGSGGKPYEINYPDVTTISIRRDVVGFRRLSMTYDSWGDRLTAELRGTAPYQIYFHGRRALGKVFPSLAFKDNNKSDLTKATDTEILSKSAGWTSDIGENRDLRRNLDRTEEDPRSEYKLLSQNSVIDEKVGEKVKIGHEDGESDRSMLMNSWENSDGKLIDELARSEISDQVDNLYGGLNFIEKDEAKLGEKFFRSERKSTTSLIDQEFNGLEYDVSQRAQSFVNHQIEDLDEAIKEESKNTINDLEGEIDGIA